MASQPITNPYTGQPPPPQTYDPPAPQSQPQPPLPTDPSYRPPTDPSSSYRPPVETSFPPPPTSAYPPQPQSSGLTYPGPSAPASSYPGPAGGGGMTEMLPGPSLTPLPLATARKPSLRDARTATEHALREYMAMQRSRLRNKDDFPAGLDERLRIQASAVLGDLRSLRDEVSVLVKTAEGHRWRRFLVGGFIATFIPAVRAIFRRPASSSKDRGTDPALGMAANDTEYAFRRSKSLISRILGSVHRPGLATLAFFVFAVLYVFQNEVTLRVARTIGRRLKKLSAKVERGDEEVSEEDVKLLQNWRWRILMWS